MISPRSGGKDSGITRPDSHFGQINMTRDSLNVRISSSVRKRTVVLGGGCVEWCWPHPFAHAGSLSWLCPNHYGCCR
jgi:hypothetical protein